MTQLLYPLSADGLVSFTCGERKLFEREKVYKFFSKIDNAFIGLSKAFDICKEVCLYVLKVIFQTKQCIEIKGIKTCTLKVLSCKLYNDKYMIPSTKITNTGIFAFIDVVVFKLLSPVLFANRKDNRNC